MAAAQSSQYTYSLQTHRRISAWCQKISKLGIFETRRFGAFLTSNTNAEEPGIVVTHIEPGSFAEAIGLQQSDIVVSVNGEELYAVCDFGVLFCSQGPEPLTLKISRAKEGSESIESVPSLMDVIIPPANEIYSIGIELELIDEKIVVADVIPESAAAKAGIYEGDNILSVGNQKGGTLESMRAALRGKACTQVKITVTRDGTRGKKVLSVVRLVRETGNFISPSQAEESRDSTSENTSENEMVQGASRPPSETGGGACTNQTEQGSSVGRATTATHISNRWDATSGVESTNNDAVSDSVSIQRTTATAPPRQFGAFVSKTKDGGLLVSAISPQGLAHLHGLKVGDEILKVGGVSAVAPQQLSEFLSKNEKMTLQVKRHASRSNEIQIIELVVSPSPSEAQLCGVGMSIERDSAGIIRVTAVRKGGPAATHNIMIHDVITSVDSVPLFQRTSEEVRQMILGPMGTTVKFGILRHGLLLTIVVQRSIEGAESAPSPPPPAPSMPPHDIAESPERRDDRSLCERLKETEITERLASLESEVRILTIALSEQRSVTTKALARIETLENLLSHQREGKVAGEAPTNIFESEPHRETTVAAEPDEIGGEEETEGCV